MACRLDHNSLGVVCKTHFQAAHLCVEAHEAKIVNQAQLLDSEKAEVAALRRCLALEEGNVTKLIERERVALVQNAALRKALEEIVSMTETACWKAERDRLRLELRVACENLGKARAWLDLWRTGLPNASVKALEEALGMNEEPAEKGVFCIEHRKVMIDGVCPKCAGKRKCETCSGTGMVDNPPGSDMMVYCQTCRAGR